MATKTGGAAFPRSGADWMDTGGRVYNDSQRGMTLRDYFATHAPPPPQWWIAQHQQTIRDLASHAKLVASWNWAYADAMLATREVTA